MKIQSVKFIIFGRKIYAVTEIYGTVGGTVDGSVVVVDV